jgi:hypothetical protein
LLHFCPGQPKEVRGLTYLRTFASTKTCAKIIIAVFIVFKTWKKSVCPLVGEGINCVYSDNRILSRAKK